VEADLDREKLMQTTPSTLTTRIAAAVRRTFDGYLPSSPLTGLGRAGELAAQHPAFALAPEGTRRGA
jgi:hypothetical protein